jgi:hypothetical protein
MGQLPRSCRTDLKQRLSKKTDKSYSAGRCRFCYLLPFICSWVPSPLFRGTNATGPILCVRDRTRYGRGTHERIGPKRGIATPPPAELQACENSFSTPRPENIANLPCAGTRSTIQIIEREPGEIIEREPGEMCELLHTRADKEALSHSALKFIDRF